MASISGWVHKDGMKWKPSRLRMRLVPPIGRKAAVRIAAEQCRPEASGLKCCSGLPPNVHVYTDPAEPCWCIHVPWGDGKDGTMLRSSRIILVSKQTGEILYDGSANNEG